MASDRSASPLACQLRHDPPAEGGWNMAVDEALLNRAADHGDATLRFYQWRPATLSLGYFQPHADRELHPESRGSALVRRHSGGGAILHDRELTYSLAVPPGAGYDRDPYALYFAAHETLRDTLRLDIGLPRGCDVQLCRPAGDPRPADEPFLCFQRRSLGDLLVRSAASGLPSTVDGWHKIAGSSQRKRRGAVLQHGSVLLEASPEAPQLPGLRDLLGEDVDARRLAAAWLPRLADRLSLEIVPPQSPETMLEREAQAIFSDKFGQDAWTLRR
ncbi:lipoate--protein ligase family protein [Posidoniimonas corsicana]|nr:hypothetical protein [Posidoniimonas corsicana]